MKEQKGITLLSLVIYIVIIIIVINILSMVSTYFTRNVSYVTDTGKYMAEFNKFNMYFIEDAKNNSDTYSVENSKIVFEDGTTYTFVNNNIYRNKVKICDNVYSVNFSKEDISDTNHFNKKIIKVWMVIEGSKVFQAENEYVLKYW